MSQHPFKSYQDWRHDKEKLAWLRVVAENCVNVSTMCQCDTVEQRHRRVILCVSVWYRGAKTPQSYTPCVSVIQWSKDTAELDSVCQYDTVEQRHRRVRLRVLVWFFKTKQILRNIFKFQNLDQLIVLAPDSWV